MLSLVCKSYRFFYENNGSIRRTYRALGPFYGRHNRPSEALIRTTMDRFRNSFTLLDNAHPRRRCTVLTEDAIAVVERSNLRLPNA